MKKYLFIVVLAVFYIAFGVMTFVKVYNTIEERRVQSITEKKIEEYVSTQQKK